MKKIIIPLIFCLSGIAAANSLKLDLTHIESVDNGKFDPPAQSTYSSENDENYKGRNKGVVSLKTSEDIGSNRGLSRVVTNKSSKQSAQLDNLETNAGEMVQKIEDDKRKISNNQEEIYTYSRNELSLAQEYASKIELNHLGQELDPTVTNAFKCKDIENCNHTSDIRVIDECQSGEMLHWNGDVWECIGLFEVPDGPNCNQDQWMTTLPTGDKACVDYIYQWGHKAGVCTDGEKVDVAVCYRKQKQSDAGVIIGDDKCYGPKPKEIVTECNANWQVGGWGGCSKSCGGGVQTRSVTCPTGYNCKAAKPATSQACNTQICTTHWRTGSWGGCSKSCGGGVQSRSVTCPAGYACPGTKPATSQSCNTHPCTRLVWVVTGAAHGGPTHDVPGRACPYKGARSGSKTTYCRSHVQYSETYCILSCVEQKY